MDVNGFVTLCWRVLYENHENYFRYKLMAGMIWRAKHCVSDAGIEIESTLALERCIKRASYIFDVLWTRPMCKLGCEVNAVSIYPLKQRKKISILCTF